MRSGIEGISSFPTYSRRMGHALNQEQVPGLDDGGATLLDWLARMRDEQPVWRDSSGSWHLFRHADVLRAITDHSVFSSDQSRAPGGVSYGRNLTTMDPPEHRALRKLVSQAFSARTISRLAPRIRELSEELADGFAGRDTCDLVQDFAYPLPVIVIAELLGVPAADRELFRGWAHTLMSDVDDPTDPEFLATFQETVGQTTGYLLEHCRDRRLHPRDDLLSMLVVAEVDGARLPDDDIVTFAGLLLMSGHVTTTVLLGNAFRCLDEHPAALAEVRADRALIPGAVEEVLRHRSPFQYVKRVAVEPVELSGVTVPPDELVIPWLMSANRDERAFPDPDRFDIHRVSNAHLALGRGVHFCLGAQLARLETDISLNVLFDRFAEFRLDLRPPMQAYGMSLFGLRNLPARLPKSNPLAA
jgi:cytochrome P450